MARNLSPIKNENDVITQNYAKDNLVILESKKFGGAKALI